ncbi:HTH-type transcriptional regulator TfdS [Pseudovibrio sp. Ad13]|uniref:LysR family transcriptional regulator n=1 Tax=Pseudovibrio sp. Ad13 TaxID=989396 RepID=UPI0007AEBC1B|nr:LysR family transcriptional regulator [Pseudovibrio sp. Ad13]KZK75593.1 HTH-type transcriptional regulator TfdS [Pseudovibrio sp. Ad13]
MNWQAISFDWNQLRAFLATAKEGSFSAAARVLNTTQPTISRQLSALEASLGVSLLESNVRGQTLTAAGQELLDHAQMMGEAATLISMVADRQSQEVSGEVALAATDLMSAAILPGILSSLRESAPGITIRIKESNNILNLMRREADISIRHMQPTEPELIARHVGDLRANLYASCAYLDKEGRPRTLREVADHTFIGVPDPEHLIASMHNLGIPLRAENFAIQPDSSMVTWEMVKVGHGVSMLPEVLGEVEPMVEKVFAEAPSFEYPIWLVTHKELQTSPRIRAVFDFLANQLGEIARIRS